MDKNEFFIWCESQGLHRNREIAVALSVSTQTILNWKKPKGVLPAWVPLACRGYEAYRANEGGPVPRLPRMTILYFEDWQKRNELRTYDDTGGAFRLSRQAVHNWFRRGRFPRWVPLACLGHDSQMAEMAVQ